MQSTQLAGSDVVRTKNRGAQNFGQQVESKFYLDMPLPYEVGVLECQLDALCFLEICSRLSSLDLAGWYHRPSFKHDALPAMSAVCALSTGRQNPEQLQKYWMQKRHYVWDYGLTSSVRAFMIAVGSILLHQSLCSLLNLWTFPAVQGVLAKC